MEKITLQRCNVATLQADPYRIENMDTCVQKQLGLIHPPLLWKGSCTQLRRCWQGLLLAGVAVAKDRWIAAARDSAKSGVVIVNRQLVAVCDGQHPLSRPVLQHTRFQPNFDHDDTLTMTTF
jgi:hypothetical protein